TPAVTGSTWHSSRYRGGLYFASKEQRGLTLSMSFDSTSVDSDQTVSSGVGDDGRPRALASQPKIGLHGHLTPQAEWGDVERGNPLPYTLPPERRRAVGLERETWQLEVLADPVSNAVVEAPLSKEKGTALDFEGLLKLGKVHGVRYLKGVTCN